MQSFLESQSCFWIGSATVTAITIVLILCGSALTNQEHCANSGTATPSLMRAAKDALKSPVLFGMQIKK